MSPPSTWLKQSSTAAWTGIIGNNVQVTNSYVVTNLELLDPDNQVEVSDFNVIVNPTFKVLTTCLSPSHHDATARK